MLVGGDLRSTLLPDPSTRQEEATSNLQRTDHGSGQDRVDTIHAEKPAAAAAGIGTGRGSSQLGTRAAAAAAGRAGGEPAVVQGRVDDRYVMIVVVVVAAVDPGTDDQSSRLRLTSRLGGTQGAAVRLELAQPRPATARSASLPSARSTSGGPIARQTLFLNEHSTGEERNSLPARQVQQSNTT